MTKSIVTIGGMILLVIGLVLVYQFLLPSPTTSNTTEDSTATETVNNEVDEIKETHTLTGGEVSFVRTANFNLAVTPEQILATNAIPPCSEGFDYCLYYRPELFANTNFSAAGLSIRNRTDLNSTSSCLITNPAGYDDLTPGINEQANYTTSRFPNLQDAGAGYYTYGEMYRLVVNDHCYEFETRIVTSQFENYPAGSIEKFTDANQQQVTNDLTDLLAKIRLVGDETVIFPFNP